MVTEVNAPQEEVEEYLPRVLLEEKVTLILISQHLKIFISSLKKSAEF